MLNIGITLRNSVNKNTLKNPQSNSVYFFSYFKTIQTFILL